MSNFLGTRKKFREFQRKQDEAQRLLDAEREIEVDIRPETYIKQNNKITLLSGFQPLEYEGQTENHSRYHFTYTIQNLSDDLMIMMRPVGIFYGTNGVGDGGFSNPAANFIASEDASFLHLWEKVDDENYKLHVHISIKYGGFTGGVAVGGVQIFFDLFLYNYSFATYTEIL